MEPEGEGMTGETAYETLSRTQEGRNMDFGDVIRSMKANPGKRFARRKWDGVISIALCEETGIIKRGLIAPGPRIDIFDSDGRCDVGWLASPWDLIAEDWEELEAEQEARFPLTFREAINAMMEGRAVESEALPDVEQRLSEAGFECRKLGKDKWYHTLDFSEDEVSGKWKVVE